MKKHAILLLKVAISVAILAYLVRDALRDPDAVRRLQGDPMNWGILLAAGGLCALAVLVTQVRWWYLVRALELPLSLRDALRIGFLGYLFNLAPMGIVGGDLIKAVMLAREHREHRTRAVASVFADRLIGLYAVFVVLAAAILLLGFQDHPDLDVRWACRIALVVAAVTTLGVGLWFHAGAGAGNVVQSLTRVPRFGPTVEKLVETSRMYHRRPGVLLASGVLSIGVHTLLAVGIYLIALSLPDRTLPLAEHFVIVPLGTVASVIPLPAGPQEGTFQFLYGQLADAGTKGLVIGLIYRIITILIALIGVCYYLGARREVAEVLHEVEEEA
ncbi:MAG: lysylphosphatidylglycerol synthase transmembrane domain-containing protein [Patescibacteria group bacterium]|nr:lysylphosphatidylglycerol synthase transmembrane domain-containing protein [Patescibacteria group bacterium]